MTPDEFDTAITCLGWKQSDFCRMTGVDKNTPSRWIRGVTPIPLWAEKFVEMATRIQELSDVIRPPKVERDARKYVQIR